MHWTVCLELAWRTSSSTRGTGRWCNGYCWGHDVHYLCMDQTDRGDSKDDGLFTRDLMSNIPNESTSVSTEPLYQHFTTAEAGLATCARCWRFDRSCITLTSTYAHAHATLPRYVE